MRTNIAISHLTKMQRQRWEAAEELINNMIDVAARNDASIMFCGDIISPQDIVINNDGISVKTSPNTTVRVFDLNPEYHGFMYQKCNEFVSYACENFKIVKQLEFVKSGQYLKSVV